MKTICLICTLIVIGLTTKAQHKDTIARIDTGKRIIRICVPARHHLLKPPLYVIQANKHKYAIKDSAVVKMILKPEDIQSIDVVKDSKSATEYGDAAGNGVLIITLKDKLKSTYRKLDSLFNAGKLQKLK